VLYLGATREHLSEHNLYDTYLPSERPTISCDGINTGMARERIVRIDLRI
jgi:hypothetical protein